MRLAVFLPATFEWGSAVVWPDSLREYGETRFGKNDTFLGY